jgi:hypothetical protein
MSSQITTAFVQQYSANLQHLSQQKGSRLRGLVRTEMVRGKQASFDQIGSQSASVRTTRAADTLLNDTPHSRRMVTLADYEVADLIDDQDKLRMIVDPTSSYAQAQAFAIGRSMDDVIITAATGEAKYIMDNNDVDPSIPRVMVIGPKQLQDLLESTTITSSDYNTVKALVQGELNTFMGFNFITSTRLAHDSGTDVRTCFAYAVDGITLAVAKDLTVRIDERPDKGYAVQVYACMSIGATRMEEEKVVQISCDESP